MVDLCAFNSKAPLDYVYLKDLTSEQCEANWRKIEEPEPRRYVLPLNVTPDVSHVTRNFIWNKEIQNIKKIALGSHLLNGSQNIGA